MIRNGINKIFFFPSFFSFSKYLFFLSFFFHPPSYAIDLDKGKLLFQQHCMACHENGKNFIIPEKNLYRETLKTNGIQTLSSLSYQIINGKNGMPAFGGRLNEKDLIILSSYLLEQKEW
jgi:cytochrome c6